MINWYRSSVRMMFVKRQSPRISVPTKLIWGMRDKALSDVMAQPSIDYCDYGELAFIENASHWVQHEEPAQVNRLILVFERLSAAIFAFLSHLTINIHYCLRKRWFPFNFARI